MCIRFDDFTAGLADLHKRLHVSFNRDTELFHSFATGCGRSIFIGQIMPLGICQAPMSLFRQ